MSSAVHSPSRPLPANRLLVAHLEEIADLLEAQDASVFRVRAYRKAAESVRELERPALEIFRDRGIAGLDAVPHVGTGIARVIRDFLVGGRTAALDHLRGTADPVAILETVPGIGPILAQRLYEETGLDSLEALEAAAHDGRLAGVNGFGSKRIAGIRDALATRLGRARRDARTPLSLHTPRIAVLLDVDREYREKAAEGLLPRIAPRRFNPTGAAWLPVLHTSREGWHLTALYSNTALAHRLQRTNDWVVIYADGADGEHQHTVITAREGVLAGERVVRGREHECEAFYTGHHDD